MMTKLLLNLANMTRIGRASEDGRLLSTHSRAQGVAGAGRPPYIAIN